MTVEETGDWPAGNAEPRAILVVEDEILIRLALADDLMDAGFLVFQAADADEALKILRSAVTIDLMVTDVWMPGSMDGLQLASHVRANWPQLRIALVSGHVLARPSDVDLFFAKPFVSEMVIESIKQLLEDDEQ